MQSNETKSKFAALQADLEIIGIGITKLASMTTAVQPKQASTPNPKVGELAETLSLKLAAIGVGTVKTAAHNAAMFAADHEKCLQSMTEVADYLAAASAKTAEAPSSLGRPTPAAPAVPKQRFEPRIRC